MNLLFVLMSYSCSSILPFLSYARVVYEVRPAIYKRLSQYFCMKNSTLPTSNTANTRLQKTVIEKLAKKRILNDQVYLLKSNYSFFSSYSKSLLRSITLFTKIYSKLLHADIRRTMKRKYFQKRVFLWYMIESSVVNFTRISCISKQRRNSVYHNTRLLKGSKLLVINSYTERLESLLIKK